MSNDAPFFVCRTCGREFEPTAATRRKCSHECMQCRGKYQARWRAAKRALLPPKPPRVRQPPKPRSKSAAYLASELARQKKLYHINPEYRRKVLVRSAARDAVKAGKLFRQPCEVCGSPKVEAHHDDYSRPLDVRWLCRRHHRAHHNAVRNQAA